MRFFLLILQLNVCRCVELSRFQMWAMPLLARRQPSKTKRMGGVFSHDKRCVFQRKWCPLGQRSRKGKEGSWTSSWNLQGPRVHQGGPWGPAPPQGRFLVVPPHQNHINRPSAIITRDGDGSSQSSAPFWLGWNFTLVKMGCWGGVHDAASGIIGTIKVIMATCCCGWIWE